MQELLTLFYKQQGVRQHLYLNGFELPSIKLKAIVAFLLGSILLALLVCFSPIPIAITAFMIFLWVCLLVLHLFQLEFDEKDAVFSIMGNKLPINKLLRRKVVHTFFVNEDGSLYNSNFGHVYDINTLAEKLHVTPMQASQNLRLGIEEQLSPVYNPEIAKAEEYLKQVYYQIKSAREIEKL